MSGIRKSKAINISLILTGYNEGKILKENLKKVKKILSDTKYKWEIILFDDNSSDETPNIFKEFARRNRNVHFFHNKENVGRGGTVKRAFEKANGEVVGYVDTDFELSPIFIPEAVRSIREGADMAIGTRIYTVGAWNFTRAILTKGYIFLVRKILSLDYKDTEAGFKFFSKKKIMPILKRVEDKRWFFDTEIVARSHRAGLKIAEIPVLYLPRHDRKSSVNLVGDSVEYFMKLISFRKSVWRSKNKKKKWKQ